MQTMLVLLVVAGAAFYLVRRFCRVFKKDSPSTCGCGCEGCAPDRKQVCTGSDPRSQP